jgi:hypothetical protein
MLVWEQKSLFDLLKPSKRRVRYYVPTYIKFYTIYKYDRQKFRSLLNEWLKTDEGKNRTFESLKAKQDQILEKCYTKDDKGLKERDSDEVHIYRMATLEKIHEHIYNHIKISPFSDEERLYIDGLVAYPDEMQAEIMGTSNLRLRDRIKLHIRLLRLLRKGLSIKEALCQMKLSSIGGITENTMTATKNLLTSH